MNRRVIICSLVLIVLIALGWFAFSPREKNPVYNGKPLTTWLTNYLLMTQPRYTGNPPPETFQANDAVIAIGTNGIPVYLRMLQSRDSALKLKLIATANRMHIIKTRFYAASEKQFMALQAFTALRFRAEMAVPELLKIYEHNPDMLARCTAADALGSIGYAARAAVPALVRGATNEYQPLARHSIGALGFVGTEQDMPVVLPVLTQLLTNNSTIQLRGSVVESLYFLGSHARPAVPAMFNLIKSQDPIQRAWDRYVANAIQHIDPETAERRKDELDAIFNSNNRSP